MKKLLIAFAVLLSFASYAQDINKIITIQEVKKIEKDLSADEMKGRKTFTPAIEEATTYIEKQFKKYKLDPFAGLTTFRQTFSVYKPGAFTAITSINDSAIAQEDVIAVSTSEELNITEASNYTRLRIDTSLDLMKEASRLLKEKKNYLIFIDTPHRKNFSKLKRYRRENFKMNNNVVFILTNMNPLKYNIAIKSAITETTATNVVSMIPGRTKPDEFVIFSAHYDHIGIGKPNDKGDSIYNGANDNAAGTTAMLLLAKYFNALKNNDRTLIFVAFTGEESGGFGSRYFSTQINPDKVVAMFNIEMIGTESKWGKNSAFITGFEKSDLGKIMQQNLVNTAFRFEPDPYTKQNLFYRSDNATLAALGVPAHTISTSKMDAEPFYHTQEDEIETLDMQNMTEIIKAIAISSASIISGKDTPTRIPPLQ